MPFCSTALNAACLIVSIGVPQSKCRPSTAMSGLVPSRSSYTQCMPSAESFVSSAAPQYSIRLLSSVSASSTPISEDITQPALVVGIGHVLP